MDILVLVLVLEYKVPCTRTRVPGTSTIVRISLTLKSTVRVFAQYSKNVLFHRLAGMSVNKDFRCKYKYLYWLLRKIVDSK